MMPQLKCWIAASVFQIDQTVDVSWSSSPLVIIVSEPWEASLR